MPSRRGLARTSGHCRPWLPKTKCQQKIHGMMFHRRSTMDGSLWPWPASKGTRDSIQQTAASSSTASTVRPQRSASPKWVMHHTGSSRHLAAEV
jgi:hypothetical protein